MIRIDRVQSDLADFLFMVESHGCEAHDHSVDECHKHLFGRAGIAQPRQEIGLFLVVIDKRDFRNGLARQCTERAKDRFECASADRLQTLQVGRIETSDFNLGVLHLRQDMVAVWLETTDVCAMEDRRMACSFACSPGVRYPILTQSWRMGSMMEGTGNGSDRTNLSIQPLLGTVCMTVLLSLSVSVGNILVPAQAADGRSPTDTYHAYDKALQAAESWRDVLSFLASGSITEIAALPVGKRRQYLAFAKIVAADRNMPEILTETTDGDMATVVVSYCSEDRKRGKATVSFLREEGVWKFRKDHSDVGLETC